MSRITKSRRTAHRSRERGQAAVFLVLALGIFLIGGVGFVVDGANLWFHRQSAQTAADAACTAGAMDMLSVAAGVDSASLTNTSWIGTATQCPTNTSGSAIPPCAYAGFNGYPSSSLQAVNLSFPTTFPGLSGSGSCVQPTPACAADQVVTAWPLYMQVDVNDGVPTTFMRLVGAGPTASVPARSVCGVSNVMSPVPILVLNPNGASADAVNTLTADNGFNLTVLTGILGNSNSTGLPTLIQVNSTSSNVNLSTGTIDLSGANNGNGGSFAVAMRESQPGDPTIEYGNSARGWVDAAGIVSDPFATVPAPAMQSPAPPPTHPANCLGFAGVSCDDYAPGYYPSIPCASSPTGTAAICVQRGVNGSSGLAVFEPGIYYLDDDFFAGNSCLRPGDSTQGIGGTVFYLHGNHTLQVTSNSGQLQEHTGRRRSGSLIFDCQSSSYSVSPSSIECSSGAYSNLPSGVTSLTGNVLLGPCTGPYGDPTGTGARGILFFQDRDAQLPATDQPLWNPVGSFGLVGNIYFHYCDSGSGGGSGSSCSPNAFSDLLYLGNTAGTLGTAGANAYVVGDIVADQLHLGPVNSPITVMLNPNPQYYVLKASLLQ